MLEYQFSSTQRGVLDNFEGAKMKIRKIKTSSAPFAPLDLVAFSKALRELSDRYGVRLVNMGAMGGLSGTEETTYLAIWSTEPDENQGD